MERTDRHRHHNIRVGRVAGQIGSKEGTVGPMLSILSIALSVSLALQSQPPTVIRDAKVMERLVPIITAAPGVEKEMNQVRGGNNSGKPLGWNGTEFRSGYTKVSAQTIAEWTYDLHTFIMSQNGGWENYAKDRSPEQMDKTLVPYKVIRDNFARKWWRSNSKTFRGLLRPSQDGWLYDAILDATNVWFHYLLLYTGGLDADGVIYFDVMLDLYQRASLKDVFGP